MGDSTLKLWYDFANDKSLVAKQGRGPTLTATRAAATATRINASGVIEKGIAANTARFDHILTAGVSLGLLVEEARTNICLHSEDISNVAWVATTMTKGTTSVTAPDGTANTNVRLTASAINGTLLQTITSAIDNYVYSVYMKRVTGTGNVQLTIDNGLTWTTKILTSAWQRFDVSIASVTNPVVGVRLATSGDAIDFWGSDCNKNASFPTSYIPTVAASVTRNADDIGSADVAWYNASAGTIYSRASQPALTADTRQIFNASSGAAANRSVHQSTSDNSGLLIVSSSVTQASLIAAAARVQDVSVRMASAESANDSELYVDGVRTGTGDQTVTMPTGITALKIGSNNAGAADFWSGHIQEIRYYSARKSNQFLQDLSNGLILGVSGRPAYPIGLSLGAYLDP